MRNPGRIPAAPPLQLGGPALHLHLVKGEGELQAVAPSISGISRDDHAHCAKTTAYDWLGYGSEFPQHSLAFKIHGPCHIRDILILTHTAFHSLLLWGHPVYTMSPWLAVRETWWA